MLSNEEFDILKEIGNIGAGNALITLSKMLGRDVKMNVPNVCILGFDKISEAIGSPEEIVFGILVNLTGEITGMMMFIVKAESARKLVDSLVKMPSGDKEGFDEMDLSALEEIGNIISSTYLSSLSALIDKEILPSVPYLAHDMAAAILSVPAIEFGKISDKVLFIESVFETDYSDISGYFLLVPDYDSFATIQQALGV